MRPRAITLINDDPSAAAHALSAAFGWQIESDFGAFAAVAADGESLPIWLNAPGDGEEPTRNVILHVAADDVDAAYRGALEAGATSVREPQDMDFGERSAHVRLAELPGVTFDLSRPLDRDDG